MPSTQTPCSTACSRIRICEGRSPLPYSAQQTDVAIFTKTNVDRGIRVRQTSKNWQSSTNGRPSSGQPTFSRSRKCRKRKPPLFHPARHRRKGVVQRRTDGFHGSHNGKRNAARDNGVFDGGGAALTFQKK